MTFIGFLDVIMVTAVINACLMQKIMSQLSISKAACAPYEISCASVVLAQPAQHHVGVNMQASEIDIL